MIVWGWRSYIQALAMMTFLCGNCGNPAMHHVKRAYTKFTLFWIPLFPVSSKYYTECTFCGVTHKIAKDEAMRLKAQAEQPSMQQPAGPPTPPAGYAQQQQPQQFQQPQQQYPPQPQQFQQQPPQQFQQQQYPQGPQQGYPQQQQGYPQQPGPRG